MFLPMKFFRHNSEYLALCLHFVDTSNRIREELIGFVKMQRVRAADVADAIVLP